MSRAQKLTLCGGSLLLCCLALPEAWSSALAAAHGPYAPVSGAPVFGGPVSGGPVSDGLDAWAEASSSPSEEATALAGLGPLASDPRRGL